MNLSRTYRTVCHLTAQQWIDRILCRGKFVAMGIWPGVALKHFVRRSHHLPTLDPTSRRLADVAPHVLRLQSAVHNRSISGIRFGRFTLLNREIDFGGIDRVEWRRDLGEGNNRLWRMTLAYMGYLVPLFQVDVHTALPVAKILLTSMNEQNSWSEPGVFRDVWHPYTVSHRVINLLTCLHLIGRSGITATDLPVDELVAAIRLGTAFVLGNLERDLQYNHLLKNLVCLAVVASACTEPDFAASKLEGVKSLVSGQFSDDGMQVERSPMYNLLSLLDLRILRDSKALSRDAQVCVEESIVLCESAVNGTIHPDGDLALFNDCWLGETPLPSEAIEGLDLRPIPSRSIELPHAGYVRLASGNDSVVMDFGACGPDDNLGHAHADFLAIELSVAGERAIVDPGVPTYSEGELRNNSRSASWHNGPSIEGFEPIEFWRSFRVGRRGYGHKLSLVSQSQANLLFAGWQDGLLPFNVVVGRAILMIPGAGLLIADIWVGVTKHEAQSQFIVSDKWRKVGPLYFLGTGLACKSSLRMSALEGRVQVAGQVQYWQRFAVEHQGARVLLQPSAGPSDYRLAGLWIDWSPNGFHPKKEWTELRLDLIGQFRKLEPVRRLEARTRRVQKAERSPT
jgi:uncharacterized heparinase superfamily protein